MHRISETELMSLDHNYLHQRAFCNDLMYVLELKLGAEGWGVGDAPCVFLPEIGKRVEA